MDNKKEKIDKATADFLAIYQSKDRKFNFLPEWLEFMTTSFNKEINIRKNKTIFLYDNYKRGTIVRVNFGTNIGSEMSGIHFAVVVTKNDNENSRTLQVIPLSSKKGKFRVGINDEVFKNVSDYFAKAFLAVNNELDTIHQKLLDDFLLEILDFTDVQVKINIDKEMQEVIEILREDTEVNLSISIKKCINMMVKALDNYSENSREYEYLNNVKKSFQKNVDALSDKEIKATQFADIVEEYQKYDKNSYMLVKDFTTISKEKIISLNTYDPSGQIRVSENTLDIIDKKILEYFTK